MSKKSFQANNIKMHYFVKIDIIMQKKKQIG